MTKYTHGSCHEWRIAGMGIPAKGYVCIECRAEVAKTSDMANAPECRERLIPVSWLPSREQ